LRRFVQLSLADPDVAERFEGGFVTRRTDPDDRRALTVTLTADGVGVIDKAIEAQAGEESRILSALDRMSASV
jgi:DNA-binding MarR family transcriptional regulator